MTSYIGNYPSVRLPGNIEWAKFSLIANIDPKTKMLEYEKKEPSLIVTQGFDSNQQIGVLIIGNLLYVFGLTKKSLKNEDSLIVYGKEKETVETLYKDFIQTTKIKELDVPAAELKKYLDIFKALCVGN